MDDLRARCQSRVVAAQLIEQGDALVERMRLIEIVIADRGIRADRFLIDELAGSRREHCLTGRFVATKPGKALFVAVIHHRHPPCRNRRSKPRSIDSSTTWGRGFGLAARTIRPIRPIS